MATTLHVFSTHGKAKQAWSEFKTDGRRIANRLEIICPERGKHIFARVTCISDAHVYSGMLLEDVVFHDTPSQRAMAYLVQLVRGLPR